MTMRGVTDMYGIEEASIRALEAGSDVVLTPKSVPEVIEAIASAVEQGVKGVPVGAGQLVSVGVKKALGYGNRALAFEMVLEALVIVLLSFPLALVLASLAGLAIESVAPLYRVPVLELVPLLKTFLAALVLAVIGAYLPYRLIARLDPAQVFRN